MRAALELFTEQGFHQTTIRQVAERAEVSEQTVYNVFDDKVGLLASAGAMFIEAGGDDEGAALLEALRAETDPLGRIRIVARDSREFWSRRADAVLQLELLGLDPALSDPRLAELFDAALSFKLADTRAVCELLFPDGVRRLDLDLDTVVEFLAALDSAATIMTLRKLGWDMSRWQRWVEQLLTLFLDPAVVDAVEEGT